MMENQEKKPLYFYGEKEVTWKDKQVIRRTAIAAVQDENPDLMRIGVATCSEKDRFIRDKGRKIATGRAQKHPLQYLRIYPGKGSVATQFIEFSKKLLAEK